MLRELSRNILEISVSTGIVIGVLLLCSRWLNRRYAAKWKYMLWIVLAVRLAIPLNPGLPTGLFRFPVPQIEGSFQEQLSPEGPEEPADFVETGHMFSDFQTPSAPKETDTSRLTMEARRESDMEAVFAAVGSVLPYVWLVGFLGVLGWELFAYGCFRRSLLKNSHPVDSTVEREIGTLLREMGIGKKIPAVVSEAATSPMLVGFFRRCLILPECNYADGERFFIIKHELAHYQRHDVWYKLLFVFVRSLHWFNPLVHLMVREADLDLELSCDEEVVAGEDAYVRRIYTEALLSALDRQTKKKSPLTTQFYGGTKIMKRRFVNILEQTKKRKGYLPLVGILTITLALGTACGSASETDTEAKNPSLQESENSEIMQNTSMPEETSQMEDVSIPEPHEVYDTEMVFLVNGCFLTLHTDGSYEMVDYMTAADFSSIDELEGTYYIQDNHLFLESTHKRTRMTFEKDGDNWAFLASKSSGYDERADWFRDKEKWWPDNEPEVFIPTYEDLDGQVYIPAYIRDITENSITVDVVEYIDSSNTERINELGLTEYDMVAGYYMVNSSIQTREWKLDEQTKYTLVDWKGDFRGGQPGEFTTTDVQQVIWFLNEYHLRLPAEPFFFQVEDGVVKFVLEKVFA